MLQSLAEGFKYVWSTHLIKYVMLLFLGANFGSQFLSANLIYHLKNDYLIPENQLSYYFIPIGIASIVGALLGPSLIRRFAYGRIIASLVGLEACFILLIALSKMPLLTAGLWAIACGLNATIVITVFTMRQRIAPTQLLSRTVAVTRMIAFMAIPAGAISSGMVFKQTIVLPGLQLIVALLFYSLQACFGDPWCLRVLTTKFNYQDLV